MRFWHAVVFALCCLIIINGCGEPENKNVVNAKALIAEGKYGEAAQQIETALADEPDNVEALALRSVLQARAGSLKWPEALSQVEQHLRPMFEEIATLEAKEDPDEDDYKQLHKLTYQRNDVLGVLAQALMESLKQEANLARELPAEVTTRLMLQASRAYAPERRGAALEVLRLLNQPEALASLAQSSDAHPSVREAAIGILSELHGPASLPILESIASDQNLPFPVAYSLVMAAQMIGGRETIPLYRKLLRVEAMQARLHAAAALGRMRATEAIPDLIERLADNNSYVQNQARDALTIMGQACVPSLIQLLEEKAVNVPLPPSAQISDDAIQARRNTVQTHAMNILATLRAQEALPLLLQNLVDPDLSGSAKSALNTMGSAAVPALLELLKTGDEEQRIQASEILAGIGDLRAVPALIEALKDPVKDVRANAAQGLGNMKARGENNRAVEALLAALDSDVRTKTNAINALSAIGVNDAALGKRLIEMADSRSERQSVRLAALSAIGTLKPDGAALVLVRLLMADNENDQIRKAAATALGEIKDPDALPVLLWIAGTLKEEIKDFQREMKRRYGLVNKYNAAIRDLFQGKLAPLKEEHEPYESWRELKPIPSLVRSEVVTSLGKIKGDEVIDPLIKVLEEDQRAAVRAAAAWSLGEIGGDRVIAPLIRALKKDKQGIVRSRAAEALGKIKGEKVIDPLVHTLKHDKFENARVKAAIGLREVKYDKAARGLVSALKGEGDAYEEKEVDTVLNEIVTALEKDGSVAVPALLTAVDFEDVMVRKRAIESLGVIADAQAYDALLKALDDESVIVRERAAVRLGGLKLRKAVPKLIEVLQNPEEWSAVRAGAASSLGTLRDERAADALLEALQSSDVLIRTAAVSALGSLKEARAAQTLRAIAMNVAEDPTLRQKAVAALASIGYQDAGRDLLALLDTEQGALRNEVVKALGTLGVQEAVPRLNAILADPAQPEDVRRNAATALGKLGDESSVPILVSVLTDPTEYRITVIDDIKRNLLFEDVAKASRSFQLPKSVIPRMMERIDDSWEHKTVHWAAAIVLSRTFDDEALARVEQAAKEDSAEDVRNIAARSLGETGLKRYTPLLIAISGDSSKATGDRRGATQGLGYLGDPAAVPHLVKLLNDSSAPEEVRRDAAVALGRIGTPEAVQALEKAAGNADWAKAIRLDIITGLREAKSRSSVSVLQSLLESEDADIHFRAADALYAITGDSQGYHWL